MPGLGPAGSIARPPTIVALAGLFLLLAFSQPARAAASAPVNDTAPSISGTPQVGQTLTATNGTWTATPPVPDPAGYSYQWLGCDADGTNCSAISGATGKTYTVVTANAGRKIQVQVTASNGVSPDGTATSPVTGSVVTESPYNTAAPTVSGMAQVGQTLTATNGTWSASPAVSSYSHQWQRCETTSEAGADWTTRSVPSSFGWRSVTWGDPPGPTPGQFVAVGGDVGQAVSDDVLTSLDGVTWTTRTPAGNNYWESVTWGGPDGQEKFVAVSRAGTNQVMTSPDGITWTAQTAASARQWKSVTWGGPAGQEKFVAVAENGGIMTSPDGTAWTSQTQPGGIDRDWRSITWGDPPGATPGQFVAVTYGGSTTEQVMTSPDGLTWTARTSAVAKGWYGVTWGGKPGEEKFVAVAFSLRGGGNLVMTSPDGITWTSRTSPADRFWNSVAWGGPPGHETFVAVADTGAPGQVMTSPDGVTWTLQSSSSGEKWRAIAWGGPPGQQQFVSVAYDQPRPPDQGTGSGPNRVMTSEAFSCNDIPLATSSTYTAQLADDQKYLRVKVNDSNGIPPDGFAYSSLTARIAVSHQLTVAKSGTGTGSVISSPAGIDCGATCQAQFNQGTPVTLTAAAGTGSTFTGWSGACSGTGTCAVTMSEARSVTATFSANPPPTYVLSVNKATSDAGTGTVTSTPAGINCGSTCQASFSAGTRVTLTASAAQGSTFTGWSGACSGTAPCQVTMDSARQVTATFQQAVPSYALTVQKQGSGAGTVTSNPSGINCGTACQTSYEDGTRVTLSAAPTQGSTFTGWSGACSGAGPCQVTMDRARQVTATFTAPAPPFSDFRASLTTRRPARVPASRVVRAVRVSCKGDAPCRIDRASAKARTRRTEFRSAPVSFPLGQFPAGSSRVIEVEIPTSVYNKLKRGKSWSGRLTVDLRARGTKAPRDRTISVGLYR